VRYECRNADQPVLVRGELVSLGVSWNSSGHLLVRYKG
jgi:hypothetical protein